KTLQAAEFNNPTEVSMVLADNDFVQELNKNYRNKDKPTNVLSFPQDDEGFQNLGDVIFALETIQLQNTNLITDI
ncbi:MAG: rRNA maturation RNase YbeY, partial [Cyanobacteria bacterium P01_A01_bin.84]